MRIFILAKPKSRENSVEKIDKDHFVVKVKEPPIQGRANAAIIKELADYFNTDVYKIRIISGHTFKNKVVDVSL